MKIGIIGLGLIGGSLAMDLHSLGHWIYGVGRRSSTCQQAIDRGIVDAASPNLSQLAAMEVIFICTPLGAIESTVNQLLPHLSPDTILTDVGSVKTSVVDFIAPRWPNFVGGHPMAGTAESGLDAALAGLFVDRPYVLTPIETTPPTALNTVTELVKSLGSQLHHCSPQNHDRAVAWISHLPVMVSASLLAACLQEADPVVLELAQTLASSGFRDTSRVGGGNPELGVMMARYNKAALISCLQVYRDQLSQIIHHIDQDHWPELEQYLHHTQQVRPTFL